MTAATKNKEKVFGTIQVNVTEERVKHLLVSAFEGGSNYWIEEVDFEFGAGLKYEDFQEGGRMTNPEEYFHPSQLVPFAEGCSLIITLQDPHARKKNYKLNRAALQRGLSLMATDQPTAFAEMMEENGDQSTGDTFLQLCLFGKLIYG